MNNQYRTYSSFTVIVVLSLFFAFPLNIAFWRFCLEAIALDNLSTILFFVSICIIMFFMSMIACSLLLWPRIGKYTIIFLLVTSSIANYMMYKYGVYIDQEMIRNTFETHKEEVFGLINLNIILWIFITGIIPSFILYRINIIYLPAKKEIKRRVLIIVLSFIASNITLAGFYKQYASYGRNNREIRKLINTGNYIYATVKYLNKKLSFPQSFQTIDDTVAHVPYKDPHATVFILIVGETARSMNFSLNGYERETTPLLSKQDIISFKNVTSCGTATAISLPCIFSSSPRVTFDVDKEKNTENLVDLIQKSDYNVIWKENDFGCKGVCDRVPTIDTRIENNPKFCTVDSCFDEVLLEDLDDYLANITKDTFIVLHAIGSHGPTYYKRYPEEFKKFLPSCDTSDLNSCTKQDVVNTYDNTILYTDFVISKTIDILNKYKNLESGLLYVSDHGESLGENNVYLHGMPYFMAPKEQIQVPFILWMSQNMKQNDYINYDCLKQKAKTEDFSHDNIYHSILSLLEIEGETVNPKLDIFKSCRISGEKPHNEAE